MSGSLNDSSEPPALTTQQRRFTEEYCMDWNCTQAAIRAGLDILKRYHRNVTRRSVNLRKELSNYKYRINRAIGRPTNEPVDASTTVSTLFATWP